MQTPNLSEAARAMGQRGAAAVNLARSPEERHRIGQRAARKRWGLCLECGEKLAEVNGLDDHCFDCRHKESIAFAGLEPAG